MKARVVRKTTWKIMKMNVMQFYEAKKRKFEKFYESSDELMKHYKRQRGFGGWIV